MNMFSRLSWGIWRSYDYFNQHFPICILEKLPKVYEWEVKVKTGFRKTTTNQAKLWTWKHVEHLKNCEWCKRDSSAIMKEDLLHNQSSDPSIHLKENVGVVLYKPALGEWKQEKLMELPGCSPTGGFQASCSIKDFVLKEQDREWSKSPCTLFWCPHMGVGICTHTHLHICIYSTHIYINPCRKQ